MRRALQERRRSEKLQFMEHSFNCKTPPLIIENEKKSKMKEGKRPKRRKIKRKRSPKRQVSEMLLDKELENNGDSTGKNSIDYQERGVVKKTYTFNKEGLIIQVTMNGANSLELISKDDMTPINSNEATPLGSNDETAKSTVFRKL